MSTQSNLGSCAHKTWHVYHQLCSFHRHVLWSQHVSVLQSTVLPWRWKSSATVYHNSNRSHTSGILQLASISRRDALSREKAYWDKKGMKCGQPEKETPDNDGNSLEPNTTHIYLEGEDGTPVSKALIIQQGQKLHSIWTTLNMHGLAPTAWSDVASFAVCFVESSILNNLQFCYLQLCNDNWKLNYWIAKNYPSWVRNHLAPAMDKVVKAKWESLDNKDLIKIALDPSDGILHKESLEVLEDITVHFFFLSHIT